MRAIQIVGLVFLTTGLVHCKPRSVTEEDSATKHTLGQATQSKLSTQWASVSRSDTLANLFADDPPRENFLPNSHPISQRLQFWLNGLYKVVRTASPALTQNVPPPYVMVGVHNVINANARSVPICWPIPIHWNNPGASDGHLEKVVFLGTGSGVPLKSNLDCIKQPVPSKEVLEAWANRYNRLFSCHVSITDELFGPSIQLSDVCAANAPLGSSSGARSVMLFAQSNSLVVYSRIIESMSEETLVGILAHELAHYFRAHSVAQPNSDFFYQMNDTQAPHRPIPLKNLGIDKVNLAMASRWVTNSKGLHRIPGQKVRSEFIRDYFALLHHMTSVDSANAEPMPQACRNAGKAIRSVQYKENIGLFPLTALKKSGADKFLLAIESQMIECFSQVKMAEGYTMSPFVKRSNVAQVVNASNLRHIGRFAQFAGKGLTIADNVHFLNGHADEADLFTKNAFDSMVKRNIGWYSVEQEADDYSLEWMARAGVNPHFMQDSFLKFGEFSEARHGVEGTRDRFGGIPMGICRKLIKQNFRDESGNPIIVPVGNFHEAHHTSCYRIFNMKREIEVHNYMEKMKGTKMPVGPGPSWTEIQSMAKALRLKMAPGEPPIKVDIWH